MLEGNDIGVNVNIIKLKEDKFTNVSDIVAKEAELSIILNQRKVAILNCSPEKIKPLAIGFLFTTGMISKIEEITLIKIEDNRIFIETKKLTVHSCSTEYNLPEKMFSLTKKQTKGDSINYGKHINSIKYININMIYSLIFQMQEKSHFFKKSGGVHSSALADISGDILLFIEDISRYNTIDKIIGEILLKGIHAKDKMLIVSCRITSGIIKKVIAGNIPVIISKSAPTDTAINLAHNKGITLIGFARERRMNIYTYPKHIFFQ